MSDNIIRIERRPSKDGYNITESGFKENIFLLVREIYSLKVCDTYLLCNEPAIGSAIRFDSLKKDIESKVFDTFPVPAVSNSIGAILTSKRIDQTLLNKAREEARSLLSSREGYILQDFSEQ